MLTGSDWAKITALGYDIAIDTVVARAQMWGIATASQKLKGRMAAVVSIWALRNPSPAETTLKT